MNPTTDPLVVALETAAGSEPVSVHVATVLQPLQTAAIERRLYGAS
jgi:hypothetical protein